METKISCMHVVTLILTIHHHHQYHQLIPVSSSIILIFKRFENLLQTCKL